jgi:hypothetical protein
MTTEATTYDYNDLAGTLRYQVVRVPTEGGGKTFRQRRWDLGRWVNNLNGVKRIPYRWPDVEAAKAEGAPPLVVVEGEKDADRLGDLGFLATTSAQGAAWAWPDDWRDHFQGVRAVCVIADADEPGRKAARQRAGVLAKVVPDVRIVDPLPEVGEHGDVSDYLDAGHTADDLRAVIAGAAWFTAERDATAPPLLPVQWISEAIHTPPPEPPILVEGLMRAGELFVIVAARKYAKSWFTYQLAEHVARGEGKFLDRLPVRNAARVLICQGELNPWGAWARWRHLCGDGDPVPGIAETFERWRIRSQRVRTTTHDAESGATYSVEHIEAMLDGRLERTVAELGIGLLIVDPWAVFYDGSENSNDETEAALGVLRQLSLNTGAAVGLVHHISKVGEVREPEDLWRGASRLADWCSTGVTMLPHYKTESAWQRAGLNRQQSKRYVDLHFLRRDVATDDFSAAWDPTTGRWSAWDAPGVHMPDDGAAAHEVADRLLASGGYWRSKAEASFAMGTPRGARLDQMLDVAVRLGTVAEVVGARNAKAYRLPGARLTFDNDPGPLWSGDDEDTF